MIITKTELDGVFDVQIQPSSDERGSFARLFCSKEFAKVGLDFQPAQTNLSTNLKKSTLRGMHFQTKPFGETKLVQVISGAIYDVAVDLRPGPRYGRWIGRELSRGNARGLYLPKGIAHGFLTLTDDADVLYHMGQAFVPGQAAGIAWNDPDVAIRWPAKPRIISDRDAALPRLADIDPAIVG